MKRIKWYGVLFALFVFFMYVMGIYDLFMMLGHNNTYYESHGYGQKVMNYFTDYPIPFLAFWITNLVCGICSPVFYVTKKKVCVKIAFLSSIADTILIILTCFFRNRIAVLGWNILGFDLFILLVTLGFALFCWKEWKKEVIPQ